ncbi:MAG: hypothetical protein K2H02_03515, partial [Anaeroplasmataceae bacterium]|nr:hypothetical protein [Anaeroplasmataceae bacterium]
MKKYLVSFLMIFMFVCCLTGCKKDKTSDIDKFINSVLDSEKTFTAYDEVDTIFTTDGQELYSKHIAFSIERGDEIKTSFQQIEKRFDAAEKVTSYTTIGDKKYVGQAESSYDVPNYWLIFALNKDYLLDGYTLETNDDTTVLKAKIIDDKMAEFFLQEGIIIKSLVVQINVKDGKLTRFEANYKSDTNNTTQMIVTYS